MGHWQGDSMRPCHPSAITKQIHWQGMYTPHKSPHNCLHDALVLQFLWQWCFAKKFIALQVVHCVENGLPLLIENLPESIDIVLDNVIGKKTISRGRLTVVKIGDAEIEMHPQFRWCSLQCREKSLFARHEQSKVGNNSCHLPSLPLFSNVLFVIQAISCNKDC